jgi:hypothetical protein
LDHLVTEVDSATFDIDPDELAVVPNRSLAENRALVIDRFHSMLRELLS